MAKTDLLKDLNTEQREAVAIVDRPLKVVAGAGSGKTRVITTKIAHLINEHHYFPSRILAVTFTNKAAREMKERVAKMIDSELGSPWILTFHSLGLRILRYEYALANLLPNFNIVDGGDQKTIIHQIVQEMFSEDKTSWEDWEKRALKEIRILKGKGLTPTDARADSNNPDTDKLVKIYEAYEKALIRNRAIDLDDLLLKSFQILKGHPEVLERWQQKFNYILVDEFQDTNKLQFDLIKLLVAKTPKLTVVGDSDQTIYSWRGAKIEIIDNFHREFHDTKTVVLKQNYRSTQEILDLANDFILLNPHREIKKLESPNKRGLKPQIQENYSAQHEAKFIVKEIKRLKRVEHYKNSDFFILYRSNFWSRNLETVLENEKLPFNLIGGIKFRERKVIKDAFAFMKALLTNDDLSIERVLKVTPKIGIVTINKLRILASEQKTSLFNLLVDKGPLVLNVSKHLKTLRETFIQAQTINLEKSLAKLVMFLLTNSGYWEYAKSIDNDEKENIDNLNALVQQLSNFDTSFDSANYGTNNRLLAFLQEEALASDEDQEQSPNKITLLTVHSAKGLENKVVFVAGLSLGIFPSIHSIQEQKALEEERRLLYVAMTRAQKYLYLSYVNGEYSFVTKREMRPSPFIGELNKKYYHWHHSPFADNHNEFEYKLPLSSKLVHSDHKIDYRRNDLVHHFVLGDGVVTKVVGDEVFVAFNNPKFGVQAISINSPVLRKK